MRKLALGIGMLVLTRMALPQTSTSFELTEHVLNAGGHPVGGGVLQSASFTISLDALGDTAAGTSLGSDSFKMDAGFGSAYPPPGEVTGLVFGSKTDLTWDAERSAGTYNLYRGLISGGIAPAYGACQLPEKTTTTATDGTTPPVGDAHFFLVTAENRLDEEGTKGFESDGTERQGAVCP